MAPTASEHGNSRSSLKSSRDLLDRARDGDRSALGSLVRRNMSHLRKWAHGRLPQWARQMSDTADLVQEALLQTFQRLDQFENRGKGALQAYLRQAVTNRIRDELRRVARRPVMERDESAANVSDHGASPFDAALDADRDRKYKAALATLSEEERLLVVARVELGYNYEQLALVSNRATSEAARLAVRRAVLKVAQRMASASNGR
jgi:RNA polymerase sigma-70 factor (ECF subfamily)